MSYAQAWRLVDALDGRGKTALLATRVVEGALDPVVRELAIRLVQGERDDERRLERLWRFVSRIPYFREPIEIFAPARSTLYQGGDCDDHTIALCALAWSLRYPWAVEPHGDPSNPIHYSARLGWPAATEPHGDTSTRWIACETTIPTVWGETTAAAAGRMTR